MPWAPRNLHVQVVEVVAIYAFLRRGGENAIIAYTRTSIATHSDGACSHLKKGPPVCRTLICIAHLFRLALAPYEKLLLQAAWRHG